MSRLRYTANQAVKAKRARHDGTEYLIAPVIAIKAGVMNEELVPHDEIAAHFAAWDGRPFVLDHPKDPEGNDVSANHPDILARIGVGQFFNSQLVDSSIRGEVWVDVVKARGLGGDALTLMQRLEAGQPVEVSTAYWRDLSKEAGEFDGQEYVGVARNLRPDHIAALLNDKGACSWEDGCGVPRANQENKAEKQMTNKKRLAGILRNVAQALGLIQNEDSLEELPRRVRIAWENEHTDGDGIFIGPWVEEVLDGRIIVREEEGLLSYPFSEEGDGNFNFGQPTRVKVIYQPISEQEANVMNELIAQIVEDGRLNLSAEDLEGLSEVLLQKMVDALASLPKAQETEPEVEPVPQEKQEPESEPQANQDVPCAERMEALFAEFGGVDGMRQLLANARAITDERKQQLIADVAANSRLEEKQLEGMDEEALVALRAELVPADYSGRGGGSQSSQDKITPLVMPSLFGENGGK